jgi:hypothetical protein
MRPQVTAEIDCCGSAILSTFASQFSNWFHRPWTPMKLYVGKIPGRSGSIRESRTGSTTTKASPARFLGFTMWAFLDCHKQPQDHNSRRLAGRKTGMSPPTGLSSVYLERDAGKGVVVPVQRQRFNLQMGMECLDNAVRDRGSYVYLPLWTSTKLELEPFS